MTMNKNIVLDICQQVLKMLQYCQRRYNGPSFWKLYEWKIAATKYWMNIEDWTSKLKIKLSGCQL